MSFFARFCIICNFLLATVLGLLMAVLLVQKYDYKAMQRQTEPKLVQAQRDLREFEQRFKAKQIQLQQDLTRKMKLLSELKLSDEALKTEVDSLTKDVEQIGREAGVNESKRSGLSNAVTQLVADKEKADNDITRLEQEAVAALEQRVSADQERERLNTNRLELEGTQISHELKLSDVRKQALDVEKLLEYILRNYELDVTMPDVTAAVQSVYRQGNVISFGAGYDDGVKLGGRMIAHRGNSFVGTLIVINVTKSRSVARIKNEAAGRTIEVGDVVRTEQPLRER